MAAPPQTVTTERSPPRRTPQISESIMVQVGSVSGTKAPDSPPTQQRPVEPPIEPYALHLFLTSHSSTGPVNERLLPTPSATGRCTNNGEARRAAHRRAEDAMREFDAIFKR